jgi:hypothetical protein
VESSKRSSNKTARQSGGTAAPRRGGARRTGSHKQGPGKASRHGSGVSSAHQSIPAHHSAPANSELPQFDAAAARTLLLARFAESTAWTTEGADLSMAAPGSVPRNVYQTATCSGNVWGVQQSAAERLQSGKPFVTRLEEAKAAAGGGTATAPPGLL